MSIHVKKHQTSVMAKSSVTATGFVLLLLLSSSLPVGHWRVCTEGRACMRCLPLAQGAQAKIAYFVSY